LAGYAPTALTRLTSTGLHTFCTGQPFRLAQVRRALQTLAKHPGFDKVWVTTPGAIAEYAATLPAGCVV
jgi:hypothetical protein